MPAIDALFVAVAALLVTFAWTLIFGRALQAAKGRVPGLFAPLFDALLAADTAIYNALRGWADVAVQPFSDLVGRVIAAADALVTSPLAFARATYDSLWRIWNVEIPGAVRYAASAAAAAGAQAEAFAQGLFQALQQASAGLAADLAGLGQRLDESVQAVLASLSAGLHQALDYAYSLAQQVASYAAGLVALEASRAVQAEQQVAAEAGAEAARIEAEAQAWAAAVRVEVGQLAAGLSSDVARARAELEAELGNFQDVTQAAIAGVINSSPMKLAEALGEVGAAALAADVEALVTLSAAEIRRQLKDVEALRAKFAPQIAQAFGKVKVG